MSNIIYFYYDTDPYGFCSNFSRHPITLKGKEWPTSEHYFQAMKFEGHPDEEEIRKARRPNDAARMGRDRARPRKANWDEIRDDVMREALYAKFTQHESLKQRLLNTGSATLVEHTYNDNYWADGGDGSGKNMLGILLMELREKLRGEENEQGTVTSTS
jgi:ribA/ribD-fused uncharacterized protein